MRLLYCLLICGQLFLFSKESLANGGACPKAADAVINEYYSAIKRVDIEALKTLTASKDWIRREQIIEMSKRLKHFEVRSARPSREKGANPRTSAYIRVQEQWENPESKSLAYFEVRRFNGCWKIQDFGTEED